MIDNMKRLAQKAARTSRTYKECEAGDGHDWGDLRGPYESIHIGTFWEKECSRCGLIKCIEEPTK